MKFFPDPPSPPRLLAKILREGPNAVDYQEWFHQDPAPVPYPSPYMEPHHWLRPQFSKGDQVNITNLLISDGVSHLVRSDGERLPLEVLWYKDIIVACFDVPVDSNGDPGCLCRALIAASEELLSKGVVILIAVRIRPYLDPKAAYSHFFAGFCYPNCLSVPFLHPIHERLYYSFGPGVTFLDRSGRITQSGYQMSSCLKHYGASAYPFDDGRIGVLKGEDFSFSTRFFGRSLRSIDELAQCFRPYNTSLVCLYLCFTGEFVDKVHNLHADAQMRNLQLTIVLVTLPVNDDPSTFYSRIIHALRQRGIANWEVIPPTDVTLVRKMNRLFPETTDSLVFFGPQTNEPYGNMFLRNFGGINGYPFSRESIVHQQVSKFRNMTLDSLFHDAPLHRVDNTQVPQIASIRDLIGTKVVCIVDYPYNIPGGGYLCTRLKEIIRQFGSAFTVLYVPVPQVQVGIDFAPLPFWYIFRGDSNAIVEKLSVSLEGSSYNMIITFDETGKLGTISAEKEDWHSLSNYPFEHTLHQRVAELVDSMMAPY